MRRHSYSHEGGSLRPVISKIMGQDQVDDSQYAGHGGKKRCGIDRSNMESIWRFLVKDIYRH